MLQHESNAMDVADDIHQDDALIPSERAVLVEDGIRWKQHLAAGQHLSDWLAFGPGLMIRRTLAMRLAFVNKPEGRGYAAEFGKLMKKDGLDTMEKSAVSALLWLQNPEHLAILKEIRDGMTDSERARLNSPISARQRVEKLLKARAIGNEDKLIVPSPVTKYRERIAELDREIAALRERLLRSQDGSLFDLKKDTIENIADTIVEQLSPSRSKGIAEAIRKKLKAKVKPAG